MNMSVKQKQSSLLCLLVLILPGIILLAACRHPPLPIEGKLVYTSNSAGNMDVYVLHSDGTWANLTHDKDDQSAPAWSPDGQQIAYTTYRIREKGVLYRMQSDGTEITRIIDHENTDANPSWSPDGRQLVFDSVSTCSTDRVPNFDIFVMNIDGSGLTCLTENPAFDTDPDWSPDGKRIVFRSERDNQQGEIYVMRADGSNITRLTHNNCRDHSPVWSPDSNQIAFVSECEDPAGDITLMQADGSHITPPDRISA